MPLEHRDSENQALSGGVSAVLQSGLILENIRRMILLSIWATGTMYTNFDANGLSSTYLTGFEEAAVNRYLDLPKRNRNTETKPKWTIKNIGKMLIVSKCWDEMDNEVFS